MTYDPDLIDRLIADIRAEVARTPYAAHRAVVADQLEAARREVERLNRLYRADRDSKQPLSRVRERHGMSPLTDEERSSNLDDNLDAIDAYRAAKGKT